MRAKTQIDADFIRRVYRTSLVVWLLAALAVYGQWGGTAAIGLTLGVAVALGSLWALERAIRTLMAPGAGAEAAGKILGLGLGKFALIAAALAGAIVLAQRLEANLLVFILGIAGGFFLVHLVMLLKAVGIWLLEQGFAVSPDDRERLRR